MITSSSGALSNRLICVYAVDIHLWCRNGACDRPKLTMPCPPAWDRAALWKRTRWRSSQRAPGNEATVTTATPQLACGAQSVSHTGP